jgi:hypothetical protein
MKNYTNATNRTITLTSYTRAHAYTYACRAVFALVLAVGSISTAVHAEDGEISTSSALVKSCAKSTKAKPVALGTTCTAEVTYADSNLPTGEVLTDKIGDGVATRPVRYWIERSPLTGGAFQPCTRVHLVDRNGIPESMRFKAAKSGYYRVVFDYVGQDSGIKQAAQRLYVK